MSGSDDICPLCGANNDAAAVPVALDVMSWAEVAAALRVYVREQAGRARHSAADAGRALQEIDRVMRGAETAAPLDDLMGPS